MPLIHHLHDAAGIRGRDTYPVESGLTIGEALRSVWPDGIGVEVDIYLDTIGSDRLSIDDASRQLDDNSILFVVTRQLGAGSAISILNPLTQIRSQVQAIGWALKKLYPIPKVPGFDSAASSTSPTSPNNAFTGQSNVPRPFQAIPELFGEGWAYPDIIQDPEQSYSGNRRILRELFCLTRGEATILGFYNGTTNYDDIAGYTATAYPPGSYPSNLNKFKTAVDIDGQELIAGDDPRRESVSRGVFVDIRGSVSQSSVSFVASSSEISFAGFYSIRKIDLGVGDTLTIAGSLDNDGSYTVTDISYLSGTTTITVAESLIDGFETSIVLMSVVPMIDVIYWFDIDAQANLGLDAEETFSISDTTSNNGAKTIVSVTTHTDLQYGDCLRIVVSETVIDEDDSSAKISVVGFVTPWVGWFQLNGQGQKARIFLQMPNGIRSSSGGYIEVAVRIELDETDADGNSIGGSSYGIDYTFKGNTADGQYVSIDQALTYGYYRVRAYRVTNALINASDLVLWEQCAMLESYTGANFGDVTVIDVTRRANTFSLGTGTANQFRVNYVRKLPNWTPGGGYDATLTDARNGFRAALYQHVVAGGYPLSQMDVQSLYDIYQAIGSDLGSFSASIDDENLSHADRMVLILNAARIYPYRDGQVWRFWRDEAQNSPVVSFDIRNLTAGSSSQVHRFGTPDQYDSVELQYRDSDSNDVVTIYRRINTETGEIINDESGSRPQTINLIGCRNEIQAINRADLEIRRILYSRYSVSDVVIGDWKAITLGDTVRWADIYDSYIKTGEIIAINGSSFTTSEKLPTYGGGPYYVSISDDTGSLSTPVVATITGTNTFTASVDVVPFVSDHPTSQCGSRYIIASTDDMEYSLFTVTGIQPQDEWHAVIQMVNYNQLMYSED